MPEDLPIYQFNSTSANLCALAVAREKSVMEPTRALHRHHSNGMLILFDNTGEGRVWITCLSAPCSAQLNSKFWPLCRDRMNAQKELGVRDKDLDPALRRSINGSKVGGLDASLCRARH